MPVTVEPSHPEFLKDEFQVTVTDSKPDGEGWTPGYVRIHPWVRNDPSVYIETLVGGQDVEKDDWDGIANVIVDREEFVTALLEVFPELARA